jgi:hypothetical protein
MKTTLLTLTFFATAGFPAWGDTIPYPDTGTIAPTMVITAATTGQIDGYFYGFDAADMDLIQMCDLTGAFCSGFELANQTTPVGTEADFGSVNAGDVIVFTLENTSTGDTQLSSDPLMSADGINHAYVTPYSATGSTAIAGIPAGTFIGMEDLSLTQGTDLDYNDDQFVFTNLSTTEVPEPSMLILCMALAGLVPVARRKFGL